MARLTLAEVVAALPQFSSAERAELLFRLRSLPHDAVQVAAEGEYDDWLLMGLLHELARRGQPISRSAINKMDSFKHYKNKAPAVRNHIGVLIGADTNKAHLLALGRIVARAYVDYMRRVKGLPVGAMLANIDKVPQAIEAAFPGYLADGKLKLLIGMGFETVNEPQKPELRSGVRPAGRPYRKR